MEWEVDLMPTITREAIEWFQEELESVTAQRDELEEELEAALEENATLKAHLQRLMADRSVAV